MARDEEDDRPPPPQPAPRDLAPLSIDELQGYIGMLEAEIARVRAAIEAKRHHRSGAEGLFKR